MENCISNSPSTDGAFSDTPLTDGTENQKFHLTDLMRAYLNVDQSSKAVTEIQSARNKVYLTEHGWSMISILCEYLTEDRVKRNLHLFDDIVTMLYEISLVANPKEALLGFLEQAEVFEDDLKFKAVLKPIQCVLLKIPSRREQSLEWALRTLYAHLSVLPIPKEYHFEKDERILLVLDEDVVRIADILDALVPFYAPLVNDVSAKLGESEEVQKNVNELQKTILLFFLLQLFDRPLVYMDLNLMNLKSSKSSLRRRAEDVMLYITKLVPDLFMFFEVVQGKQRASQNLENDEELFQGASATNSDNKIEASLKEISVLSIATFFYLLLAEQVQIEHIPHVYNPVYIFQSSLPLITELLKKPEECAVHKGLLYAKSVIERLPMCALEVSCLDLTVHRDFSAAIINVTVYNSVKEFREIGIKILPEYIRRFDAEGRHQLLKNLFNSNNHSGVIGFLITVLKDNIAATLQQPHPLPYFIGRSLHPLLFRAFMLPNGAETDILENSDQIISALNLLRFLLIRDKADVTGIWMIISKIQEEFLKPLQIGLELSRSHYELQLLQPVAEHNKNDTIADFSVTIGGESFSGLHAENMEHLVNTALNIFDLIKCILSHVNEFMSATNTTH